MSARIDVFKLKISERLFSRESLSVSFTCTHTRSSMGPEIDMWTLPEGSELIWCTVAYLYVIFGVDFPFHNAAGVEQDAGESKKGKRKWDRRCVIYQWDWLLMCWYMRERWGALKPKSDARLSTQLDFKEAGSHRDAVEFFGIGWDRKRKQKNSAVYCVRQPMRRQI